MKNSFYGKKILVGFFVFLTVLGCGGGGGGGSDSFAGTYDVFLIKTSDTCQGGFDETVRVTNTVNQDGIRIVLNSGSLVLEGMVNSEGDGFTVTTSRPPAMACSSGSVGSAYVYGPTDTDADFAVGFAIVSTCGNVTCEVSYGGVASRS